MALSIALHELSETLQAFNRSDNTPSPRPSSSQQQIDWDRALLEAEEILNSVGYWLLSDARSSRRLHEAARRYDQRRFSSVLSPLLEQYGQEWKKAARDESRKEHDISHYLENNHEALTEWLYAKLNGVEKVYKGQGKRCSEGVYEFDFDLTSQKPCVYMM